MLNASMVARRTLCAALLWAAAAQAADPSSAPAPDSPADLPFDPPRYSCVNAREGKGVIGDAFNRMLNELRNAEDESVRVTALKQMRRNARSELEKGVVDIEQARQDLLAGRDDEALKLIEPQLANPYLARMQTDRLRIQIAAIELKRRHDARAIAMVEPIVVANCAPPPMQARQLLLQAYLRQNRYADALAQLDQADLDAWQPNPEMWIKALVDLRCHVEGEAACVRQIAQLAQRGGMHREVVEVAEQNLAPLSSPEAAQALVDARQAGLIDGDRRIVPRERAVVQELKPIYKVAPVYPQAALHSGISGYVKMQLTVAPDGTVKDAVVVDGSPRDVFDRAALEAARKSRFEPQTVDGRPTEAVTTYTIYFRIAS